MTREEKRAMFYELFREMQENHKQRAAVMFDIDYFSQREIEEKMPELAKEGENC